MGRKGDPDGVEGPDVEIGARVKAERLRFGRKPRVAARAGGGARTPAGREEAAAASGSERRNLPDEVEPGVSYRDVEVRWSAAARLGRTARAPSADRPPARRSPGGRRAGS